MFDTIMALVDPGDGARPRSWLGKLPGGYLYGPWPPHPLCPQAEMDFKSTWRNSRASFRRASW